MKTRAVTRSLKIKEVETAAKVDEAEKVRIANEKWVKEGQVIDPRFSEPSEESVAQWKMFITAVYNHPNILAHPDVQCVRDLFQMLGAYITFETADILIELGPRRNENSLHCMDLANGSSSLSLLFGKMADFELISSINAVIVRSYTIMEDFKKSMFELVDFVLNYPEVLLYPNFRYLHDFLVTFGVSSDRITFEIFYTQLRRAESKSPASTLLIKLGVPESKTVEDEERKMQRSTKLSRNSFGSFSEDDSGIGSCDTSDSFAANSDSEVDIFKRDFEEEVEKENCTDSKVEEVVDYDEDEDGNKHFKCPVCLRKYISKGNCNWHIRKRHPQAPLLPGSKGPIHFISYFCPICRKGFTAEQYVKNHIAKIHPRTSASKLKIIKKDPSDAKQHVDPVTYKLSSRPQSQVNSNDSNNITPCPVAISETRSRRGSLELHLTVQDLNYGYQEGFKSIQVDEF